MCGRYNIISDTDALLQAFEILQLAYIDEKIDGLLPNFNIAPTDRNLKHISYAPIVRLNKDGKRELVAAVWPLIPKWAKGDIKKVVSKYSTANAKAENLSSTVSYKGAWKNQQRCLIPATMFYEWKVMQEGKPKQPYCISVKSQPVFAMAGIWEESISPDGEKCLESFAIITTKANGFMQEIHNRMPVILRPDQFELWLESEKSTAEKCLTQYPDDQLQAHAISTAVNNPTLNDAKLIEPIK